MKTYIKRNTLLHAVAVMSAVTLCASAGAQTATPTPVSAYSNTTTFTGSAATFGGATGNATNTSTKYTTMVADDLILDPALSLGTVTQFKFSLANLNTSAQSITPYVRFYSNNGANGGPGTLLASFNFGAATLNASSVSLFTYTLTAAQQFQLPASGQIWAGLYMSAAATAAVVNNFGSGLYNPPTVGSSLDRAFFSSSTGTANNVSSPGGTITNAPYTKPANFGWEITASAVPPAAVPEPGSIALLGMGAVGLLAVARRRFRHNS